MHVFSRMKSPASVLPWVAFISSLIMLCSTLPTNKVNNTTITEPSHEKNNSAPLNGTKVLEQKNQKNLTGS